MESRTQSCLWGTAGDRGNKHHAQRKSSVPKAGSEPQSSLWGWQALTPAPPVQGWGSERMLWFELSVPSEAGGVRLHLSWQSSLLTWGRRDSLVTVRAHHHSLRPLSHSRSRRSVIRSTSLTTSSLSSLSLTYTQEILWKTLSWMIKLLGNTTDLTSVTPNPPVSSPVDTYNPMTSCCDARQAHTQYPRLKLTRQKDPSYHRYTFIYYHHVLYSYIYIAIKHDKTNSLSLPRSLKHTHDLGRARTALFSTLLNK